VLVYAWVRPRLHRVGGAGGLIGEALSEQRAGLRGDRPIESSFWRTRWPGWVAVVLAERVMFLTRKSSMKMAS